MSGSRRRFSAQFKDEGVQVVLQSGDSIAKGARDLQTNEGTLGNWVTRWREENPEPEPDLAPVERARLRELEHQNRKLQTEIESLKKAVAFFAHMHQ